jgi:hypothetical protein
MPAGRPTIYTDELADKICGVVATNPLGLPRLCKMFDFMPDPDTIRVWRWEKPIFSAKYTQAKQFQAELMAESSEDVIEELTQYEFNDKDGATRIDAGIIARARLLIDTRKWHASKLAPKIYGDKIQTETINESNNIDVAEKVAKIIKESEKDY